MSMFLLSPKEKAQDKEKEQTHDNGSSSRQIKVVGKKDSQKNATDRAEYGDENCGFERL